MLNEMASRVSPPSPAFVRRHLVDRVAILTLDRPGARHVTVDPEFAAELDDALTHLEVDTTVDAVVLRSEKFGSFCAGVNLDFVRRMSFATIAEGFASSVARAFQRLSRLGKPVVACVEGLALGFGFEIALASTATVASDSPACTFALPEVKFGLLPAGNGLLRVAERAGLRVATDLGLSGRKLRAHEAWKLGLVDEVVDPSRVLDRAIDLARTLARDPSSRNDLPRTRAQRARAFGAGRIEGDRARPTPNESVVARVSYDLERAIVEGNPLGRALFWKQMGSTVEARTHGHYPAEKAILDVLERFGLRGFQAAAKLEARSFGTLVVSPTSRRLVDLFFSEVSLKKDLGSPPNTRTTKPDRRPVERSEHAEHAPKRLQAVGIVGAGLMGAGIAATTIRAGIPVRLRDTDDVHLERGLRYVHDAIDTLARKSLLSPVERLEAFGRLQGGTGITGLRDVDIVIEAVFEDVSLKHDVLRIIEDVVDDDCTIASNTSSLPISRIADGAKRPERIVGMHYFRPAFRVPLVEVVRTPRTSPESLVTAVALGKRQRKNVVVVADGPGFYTTRVFAPWLAEAVRMVGEGASIETVDGAVTAWGFSAAPLQLFDDLGIELATNIAEVLHEGLGERMRVPDAFEALRRDDRKGRKNGRGFYLYDVGYGRFRSARRRPDTTVYEAIHSVASKHPSSEDVALRCSLALINEAIRCLADGILATPRDGDIAAIVGLGFPAFRGGPFRYVDTAGATEVLRHLRMLEQRFGPRFEPAPLLVDMARHGKRFYDDPRVVT